MGAASGRRAFAWLLVGGSMLLFPAACREPVELEPRDGDLLSPPAYAAVPAPLPSAHCTVDVQGVGVLDVEEDYLPQVIFCENNGANFEALKAQAIAARSVAYYNMETEGSICDSQGCQVFTCNGTAGEMHRAAVEATSGLYLSYDSVLTYGFYVAGDDTLTPPACLGNDGDASTEHYVTYNEGRSGFDVDQTTLGSVIPQGDPSYGQNRGCMSQWGSRCLENDAGYDAKQILEFYYGADIEILQAQGPCVSEVDGPVAGTTSASTTTSGPTSESSGVPEPNGEPDTAAGGTSGGSPSSNDTDDPTPFETEGAAGMGTDSLPDALPDTYARQPQGCSIATGRDEAPTLVAWLALFVVALRRRHNGETP